MIIKREIPRKSREVAERGARGFDVESDEWRVARACVEDLKELKVDSISAGDVVSLAARWHVSRATVWRRIRGYQKSGNLTGLLPARAGRKPGVAILDAAADEVIRTAARQWWRRTDNATIAEIEPTVAQQCVEAGVQPPSRATIARRLRQLRQEPENFTGEARQALRERRRLMRSSFAVEAPLNVVQIDHTVADVFIVDPVTRQCIGRPTLTIAIDVATRCVLGHCLSLEAPSALLVALCLEQAVFPKEEWVAAQGLAIQYPMHGLPKALHCDNGEEFHSAAFRRGCDLYNIDTIYRPPSTPRFGGHVERLIGTLMRRVRLLPGNSYSNILRRRQRNAESNARPTLCDLQRYIAQEVFRYHQRSHRALGMSPRQAWELEWARADGHRAPIVPADRMSFRLAFLPVKRRIVGREGIELFGLKYACGELAEHVAPGVQRIVRFDPRDLSRVYLEASDTDYLCVPLRDRRLPPFSLWEWLWMRQHQRQLVERPDGEALDSDIARMESILAPPAKTPLQGRRRAARAAEWRELQRLQALPAPDVALEATITAPADETNLAWEILE